MEARTQSKLKAAVVVTLTVMLYVISCWLPAISINVGDLGSGVHRDDPRNLAGYMCLQMLSICVSNPLFLMVPPVLAGVLANVLVWSGAALLVTGKPKRAAVIGLIAFAGASYPFMATLCTGEGLLAGYYLWWASTAVLASGAFICWPTRRSSGCKNIKMT